MSAVREDGSQQKPLPCCGGSVIGFLRDPFFYAAAMLGSIGWLLPEASLSISWPVLLFKALAEEVFFRFFLQETLDGFLRRRYRFGPLSLANIVVSMLFSGMHLWAHPPIWALLVFFPSLIFGWAWDRYRALPAPWLLHFWYNVCYFHQVI